MDEKLVSVIIPAYHIEDYIGRCLDSIISQTYKNLELIVVDDGSRDRTGEILDDYVKKDPRMKVVHKKNGGLASARNAGLTIAKGEYIVFVDSDDWIELNMLEELLEKANNGNYDFIRFRPVYEGWPGIEDGTLCDFGTESMLKEGGYDKEDLRREVYPYLFATPQITLGPIVAAWRSMYKRSFG